MSCPALIIGDSHCTAIVKAVRDLKISGVTGGPIGAASYFQTPFFEMQQSGLVWRHAVLSENFRRWQRVTGVRDIFAQGNRLVLSMGLAAAPFYGNRMWIRAGINATDKQHISIGLLNTMVADIQQYVLAFYSKCAEMDVLAAVIDSPPPQRRHQAVAWMGEDGVLELDRNFRAPVLEALSQMGVPIVRASLVTDQKGFLEPEFWGTDPSHGNMDYGRATAFELERLILATPC